MQEPYKDYPINEIAIVYTQSSDIKTVDGYIVWLERDFINALVEIKDISDVKYSVDSEEHYF